MIAERVLGLGVGLLVSVLLARHLGVAGFGQLQYAISFCGLLGLLTGLGLDAIVVRELVRNPERAGMYLGTTAALKTGAALVVITVLLIAGQLIGHDRTLQWMTLLVSLALLPQALAVVDFLFQARVAARWSSLAKLAAAVCGAIFVLYCVSVDAPLARFAAQPLVESLVLAAGLLYGARRVFDSLGQWSFDRQLAVRLMQEGWPLAFAMGLVSIYAHTDRIMVRMLLGDESTGLYAAAAKLSEAWYFLPLVIVSSVFPALVRAREKSQEHYHRRLQNLFDLMVWMAVVVAVPVWVWADDILALVFGEGYREAGTVLGVHIWTGVLIFLGVASGRWMILEGMSGAYLARSAVGVAANIVGNWLLIPRVGVVGAAISTLVAQVVVVFAFDAILTRTRPVFLMKCKALVPIHWFRQY
jgi:O-antigen/teichoic acid export membrane protein